MEKKTEIRKEKNSLLLLIYHTLNLSQFCEISVKQRIFLKLFWGSITQIKMKSFSVVKYFNY